MPNDAMGYARPRSGGLPRSVAGQAAAAPPAEVSQQALRCPVCLHPELFHSRHNLTRCERCRHIFQSDLRVSMVYDGDYAHQYDRRPHAEMSCLRWEFIQQHLALRQGSKILDVGYGNGAFLHHARRAGMEVFGIDLHGEEFGITEVGYGSPIHYDLVCFFDSIEHFTQFHDVFRLDARHVILSIPDPPDLLLSEPTRWRHFKPGEHLHYFSRESLDLLADGWGMRLKIAEGHPEDAIRGKLAIEGCVYDNIYTAIYGRTARS